MKPVAKSVYKYFVPGAIHAMKIRLPARGASNDQVDQKITQRRAKIK